MDTEWAELGPPRRCWGARGSHSRVGPPGAGCRAGPRGTVRRKTPVVPVLARVCETSVPLILRRGEVLSSLIGEARGGC